MLKILLEVFLDSKNFQFDRQLKLQSVNTNNSVFRSKDDFLLTVQLSQKLNLLK